MVTCQSSELGCEVTVELPADFLSLGRGSVMVDIILDDEFVTSRDCGFLRFLIKWHDTILILLGYKRMIFVIWILRC